MAGPPLTFTNWLLAAAPIGAVLVLMVVFRWGGAKAGPAGWLTALIIGLLVYKGSPELIAYSQLEAVLLSLYVLYIIWMALVLFRIVERAGAVQVIGKGIIRLTGDRLLQLLILAWVFSAFLQGVAGFGVPVAVVAPLLIGLNFDPVLAVAAVAIGHSWSVTFGDIASSFNALIAATGLSGWELAPWSATLLGVACIACGVAVAHAFARWRGVKHGLMALMLIGGVMALTQYLLATNGLWNLAGFVAGMAGLAVSVVVTRLPLYRQQTASKDQPLGDAPDMSLWVAIAPYLILIVVVAAAELWTPLHTALNQVKVQVHFPRVSTALGWVTPERTGKNISLFGHAGALLAYTSIAAFIVYLLAGHLTVRDVPVVLKRTVRSAVPSSLGIVSMVGMAMIMARCGMTQILAQGLSETVGSVFPFISPFIGLLGAFMTGSNTNSNVIFAQLQQMTAQLVGVSVLIILAAQTTGGSLGSMLAPAKVIVGCSTSGLEGQEGRVMRITLVYGLLIAVVIGAIAWFMTSLG
jgi:lactate permease